MCATLSARTGCSPSEPSPAIYNVCSGRSVSTGDQVRLLAELLAPIEVEHEVDSARVRAHEVMDLRGSNERLRQATGWQPEIPFRQTVSDSIEWWERELSRAAPARDAASGLAPPRSVQVRAATHSAVRH